MRLAEKTTGLSLSIIAPHVTIADNAEILSVLLKRAVLGLAATRSEAATLNLVLEARGSAFNSHRVAATLACLGTEHGAHECLRVRMARAYANHPDGLGEKGCFSREKSA